MARKAFDIAKGCFVSEAGGLTGHPRSVRHASRYKTLQASGCLEITISIRSSGTRNGHICTSKPPSRTTRSRCQNLIPKRHQSLQDSLSIIIPKIHPSASSCLSTQQSIPTTKRKSSTPQTSSRQAIDCPVSVPNTSSIPSVHPRHYPPHHRYSHQFSEFVPLAR